MESTMGKYNSIEIIARLDNAFCHHPGGFFHSFFYLSYNTFLQLTKYIIDS